MRFEKETKNYPTTNAILTASEYLESAIERMTGRLEKLSGCDVSTNKSRVSYFSNYICFSDPETYDTILEIRISDHMNHELHNFNNDSEENIWINGRLWKDIKKEILDITKKFFQEKE